MTFYEDNRDGEGGLAVVAVPFDEAEIDRRCFGVEPEESAPAISPTEALMAIVFELGQWAGKDKVKSYAAQVVLRQATVSVKNFAVENHVSDSFVRRRIREASALIGSAANPDK